ncbi:MAG: putative aminohydrolase SsnA [Chloroflexi bacterium]|nr:putative aminohydrolase SsnA [Chloroflexota bacterium]
MLLITNGTLITWEKPNRILEKYALAVDGDRIVEIGPQAELLAKYPQAEQLDAKGQYVMPGNICAHTHFYGAFARGMAIPGAAPANFSGILEKLWWSLDKSLTMEDVRYSALVCLVDAIRHGTTTLIDHHASPNAIDGSLDVIAEAVEVSGLRASLCYEVTDRDGAERARKGIDENVRFIKAVQSQRPLNGRLAASFGLHASLTLSDQTLQACREAIPSGAGFHIHVAEDPVDEYDSLAKSGMRVVDRLQKFGILGPKTIVVHAVHIDVREIMLLAETDTWVTHQPRSNMNNAVGLGNVEGMMRAGVKVGLGNDGFSNAMWEEWKTAYLVHKHNNHDPRRMPADAIAQMAVYNNSDLVNALFPGVSVGSLTAGSQADIIFVDYHPYTEVTTGNLPWHIVFGFRDGMVSTTMVAGKVLMRDWKIQTLDEGALAARASALSAEAWKRYQKLF